MPSTPVQLMQPTYSAPVFTLCVQAKRPLEASSYVSSLVPVPKAGKAVSKPRTHEEMEQDWRERVLNESFHTLRPVMVKNVDGIQEIAEDKVWCVPCWKMVELNAPFQLRHYDGHCGNHD